MVKTYKHKFILLIAAIVFLLTNISYSKDNKDFAVVLDNNRIENLIFIPKADFLYNWKNHYDGCATVLLYNPTPKKPWVNPNVKQSVLCKDCNGSCTDCGSCKCPK